MINLDDFVSEITHKKGRSEESAELAGCSGYLLDFPNGVAEALDFRNNELSYVDYFWLCNTSSKSSYTLIELSDIKDSLEQAFEKIEEISGSKPTEEDKKEKLKMAWLPLVCEIMLKIHGSRVVIERLHHDLGSELSYDCKLIVVVKNESGDPIILDRLNMLAAKIDGKISTKVCMSKNLCDLKKDDEQPQ